MNREINVEIRFDADKAKNNFRASNIRTVFFPRSSAGYIFINKLKEGDCMVIGCDGERIGYRIEIKRESGYRDLYLRNLVVR